jgi:hypothetical protein
MDTYGARLAKAMHSLRIEVPALAKHLEVSPQAIRKLLAGTSKMMNAEHSAKTARFLHVDHHWLATGEGPMLPAFSPLAVDLARAFDQVPLDQRDRLHAALMYTIDLAIAPRPATAAPAPSPTVQPPLNT